MAKIHLPDNQDLEVPDEIAKDDETLRNALAPYVPDIRNAELKRTTKDGVMTVTVVKKAGPKGSIEQEVVAVLAAAPEHVNPAVVMYQRLIEENPKVGELMRLKPEIDHAIKAGRSETDQVKRARNALIGCVATPASRTPMGF